MSLQTVQNAKQETRIGIGLCWENDTEKPSLCRFLGPYLPAQFSPGLVWGLPPFSSWSHSSVKTSPLSSAEGLTGRLLQKLPPRQLQPQPLGAACYDPLPLMTGSFWNRTPHPSPPLPTPNPVAEISRFSIVKLHFCFPCYSLALVCPLFPWILISRFFWDSSDTKYSVSLFSQN